MPQPHLFASESAQFPTYELEQLYSKKGVVVGVDEAGRGALAGPVVAAAVQLPLGVEIAGLHDSKKLTPKKRAHILVELKNVAIHIGIGVVSAQDIDNLGILPCTMRAMHKAVAQIPNVNMQLIDGNYFTPNGTSYKTIVKGDARCMSIAAASIVAKEHRDHLVKHTLHNQYPHYHFNAHSGYGTLKHRQAIQQHGPCPEHRKTFLTKILGENSQQTHPDSKIEL